MPQITTGTALLLTRKALMLAPCVSTGVAVGPSARGTCGLPFATGSTPASATTTLASVARVQVPASNEWSKTCRRSRSGVGQAWLAQRVGISLYSALIMILLPRKPFFENSRLKAV
jgi:hypothetical protein